jgi:hypothetical protein
MRARIAIACLVLLCAWNGRAQELDVFDPTDFLDPRERGAVFRDAHLGVSEPGSPFSLVRVYGGRVTNYQWRTVTTEGDLSFVHATANFYRGDRQLNVKLTTFRPDGDTSLPNWRATVQLGQYVLGKPVQLLPSTEPVRVAGRVLATWSVEQNPFRDDPDAHRTDPLNHEFGLQADLRVPLPRPIAGLQKIDGSFIWMRRRLDAGNYVDRVSYLYRIRERLRSNHRLELNAAFGAGADRSDAAWHCCVGRAVLTASYAIPWIDASLNVAVAPTYTTRDTRRIHTEYAIYLDRTVMARLANLVAAK